MPKRISNTKKIIQSKSQKLFTSRQDAFEYLERTVFNRQDFVENVSDSARDNKVSYLFAYEIITNYLTDVLYEIDKHMKKPTKVKLVIKAFFSLSIGFMSSFDSKRLFLQQLLKKKNYE